MSAHLKEMGLFGFASWTRIQAREEVEHGLKLFDYLIERNSFVTLKQIKEEFNTKLNELKEDINKIDLLVVSNN